MERSGRTLVPIVILAVASLSTLVSFPTEVSAYTPHDPIYINGNGDFTAANGVAGGSGTPSDPYIIEGWEINASTAKGILILNTNVHFVIRDVHVYSGFLDDPPNHGISLQNVANGRVENSSLSDNGMGIALSGATNITIRANTFSSDGVAIEAYELSESNSHTITTDNLVNGKPLYYYKDCTDLHVDGGSVGQLIVTNCTRVQVTNLQIGNTAWGIQIGFVEDASIIGNTVSGSVGGILLRLSANSTVISNNLQDNMGGLGLGSSNNVTVMDNNVSGNDLCGIILDNSKDIIIGNNSLTDNNISIVFEHGNDITIEGNAIRGNEYGIIFGTAERLLVYHNDFVDNTVQAYPHTGPGDSWDNGYPSGGNYWSDYTGIDNCSGPNQDVCPDPDGIGDEPYIVDTDSQDRYPLMSPTHILPARPPTMSHATLSGKNLENVSLEWSLSPDDGVGIESVVGYSIYRNVTHDSKGLGYELIASLPNGTSVFVDNHTGEGDPKNYFYRVCAVDVSNNTTCAKNQAGKFTRALSQGPNLVSIPLLQSDETIETVLRTVKFGKAWYYDSLSQEWKWYMRFKDYRRGLLYVNLTMGLWVNVTGDCNLTVAGAVPVNTIIQLSTGWNLVGFPSFNATYTVSDLKAEVGATRVEGYDSLPPYYLRVLPDAEVPQAGHGYWVRVDTDTVWTVNIS